MCTVFSVSSNVNTELGGRLAAFREQSGYTIDHVVALSGMDQASLAEFESGDAKPSVEALEQLSAIYKVSMVQLLNDVEGDTS